MNDLLAKLSSYNLFNNLLPGALYGAACSYFSLFTLDPANVIGLLVAYYFFGLVIGRVGSVIIEPALKAAKWVKFAPYKDYVHAAKDDERIGVLVETNNTYRALLSTAICLAITLGVAWIRPLFPANTAFDYISLLVGITVLFFFAYRKQTDYIRSRVEIHASGK
jgi:hypothetical protein